MPTITATPSVTATPSITGCYCCEVEPNPGLGIELPKFDVGDRYCYGLAGRSLSVPGVAVPIEFPGIEVCFVELTFGSVALFGLNVSLDLLAFVACAALVLRWLFRS
jgi:hypothetical protein